jgi:hypothetical protein
MLGGQPGHRLVTPPQARQHRATHRVGQGRERAIEI